MTDPRLQAVYFLFKPMPETNVYAMNGEVSVHFEYAHETLNFSIRGADSISNGRLVCEVRPLDMGESDDQPESPPP